MKRIYWYPQTLRKITSALLLYFSDLHVRRKSKDDDTIQDITVPIVFGPIGKAYAYRKEMESKKIYYQQRPKITFAVSGIQYDPDRARSTQEVRLLYDPWLKGAGITGAAADQFWADIMPAPYTISYKAEFLAEYMDDYCQMIEQILPWFNPHVFLRIKELPFSNIERDLHVTQSGITTDFQEEYNTDDELKIIKGVLNMEVKAWFYKPIRDAGLIDIINTQFYIDDDINAVAEYGLFGSFDLDKQPPAQTNDKPPQPINVISKKRVMRGDAEANVFLTDKNIPSSKSNGNISEPPINGGDSNQATGCGNPACPGYNDISLCPCSGACLCIDEATEPKFKRQQKRRRPK